MIQMPIMIWVSIAVIVALFMAFAWMLPDDKRIRRDLQMKLREQAHLTLHDAFVVKFGLRRNTLCADILFSAERTGEVSAYSGKLIYHFCDGLSLMPELTEIVPLRELC